MKYNVMIMPVSRPELEKLTAHHSNPSWPGIKLGEGEMPLFPKPTTAWQCPVVPLFRPGLPLSIKPHIPDSKLLRKAISAVMRKAGAPEGSRSAATMSVKWDKITKIGIPQDLYEEYFDT